MERPLERADAWSPIDRTAEGTEYEDPKGELEQVIATIWRDVFGFDRIGRNDNFFELGGDSVLGMELTDKLAKGLGTELSVVTLFLNPTIREIAELATQAPLP
jgi:arthrofactin-type cyclic lipopeptide synthetase C